MQHAVAVRAYECQIVDRLSLRTGQRREGLLMMAFNEVLSVRSVLALEIERADLTF